MKPFRHHFRVPFHELDSQGILFHTHLFIHAHETHEMMMKSLGFGLSDILQQKRRSLPIVNTQAEYHLPLRIDERVEIQASVTRIGQRSFCTEYRFLRDQQTLCATVRTTYAYVDVLEGRAACLPEPLKTGLAAYLAD